MSLSIQDLAVLPARLLIRNARLMDPVATAPGIGSLYLQNGRIASPAEAPPGTPEFDADGLALALGFWDLHVHLREPGGEDAESIESGCRAAAAGGFTTIVAMPNTNPPIDSPARVRQVMDAAARVSPVHVLVAPCLTRGRTGREPADLPALAAAGAAAFTDDGSNVADEAVLGRALRLAAGLGLPFMDHALDPALAGSGAVHSGRVSARLGIPGIPSEAEIVAVERDIRLCEQTGVPVHIQHVSCARTIELVVAAARRGIPITCEAAPHHIALCEDDIPAGDTRYKMNPPLRTGADRDAIAAGVASGTVMAIATDHAPHPAARKGPDFRTAAFGCIGLENAIGVTYTSLVRTGRMDVLEWVRRFTSGPAAVLRRPAPSLRPGAPADLVLLDIDHEWRVRAETFQSRSRNCPFDGRRLFGRAVLTLCGGRTAWCEPSGFCA